MGAHFFRLPLHRKRRGGRGDTATVAELSAWRRVVECEACEVCEARVARGACEACGGRRQRGPHALAFLSRGLLSPFVLFLFVLVL